jgi:hypothetical protein
LDDPNPRIIAKIQLRKIRPSVNAAPRSKLFDRSWST